MDTLSYKTISVNKETAKKEWVVVDASEQVVGRLCSKVAKLLRGKYKPTFTPHVDCGDNVIIINADKVVFTGKKDDRNAHYETDKDCNKGRHGLLQTNTFSLHGLPPPCVLRRTYRVRALLPTSLSALTPPQFHHDA